MLELVGDRRGIGETVAAVGARGRLILSNNGQKVTKYADTPLVLAGNMYQGSGPQSRRPGEMVRPAKIGLYIKSLPAVTDGPKPQCAIGQWFLATSESRGAVSRINIRPGHAKKRRRVGSSA